MKYQIKIFFNGYEVSDDQLEANSNELDNLSSKISADFCPVA